MRFIHLFLALVLYLNLALAHEGDLNGDGCHIDPETGQYHCH